MSGLGGGLGRSIGHLPGSYLTGRMPVLFIREQQEKSLPDRLSEHKQFGEQTHDMQLDYDKRRQASLYPGATTQELLGAPGTTGAGAPSTPFGNGMESQAFAQAQERAQDRQLQLTQTKMQVDAQRDVARIHAEPAAVQAQAATAQAQAAGTQAQAASGRLTLDQARFEFEKVIRNAGLDLDTRDVVTREGHLKLDQFLKSPGWQAFVNTLKLSPQNVWSYSLMYAVRKAIAQGDFNPEVLPDAEVRRVMDKADEALRADQGCRCRSGSPLSPGRTGEILARYR